jgi:hypothetical protein
VFFWFWWRAPRFDRAISTQRFVVIFDPAISTQRFVVIFDPAIFDPTIFDPTILTQCETPGFGPPNCHPAPGPEVFQPWGQPRISPGKPSDFRPRVSTQSPTQRFRQCEVLSCGFARIT